MQEPARRATHLLPAARPLRRADGLRQRPGFRCGRQLAFNPLPRSRKMKRQWVLAAVVAAIAGAAGCATSDGPQDYDTRDARVMQSVTYGTGENVRAVRLNEDQTPVGTVAGAAGGGILGSQVGDGAGRAVGAILGAVGGGVAG